MTCACNYAEVPPLMAVRNIITAVYWYRRAIVYWRDVEAYFRHFIDSMAMGTNKHYFSPLTLRISSQLARGIYFTIRAYILLANIIIDNTDSLTRARSADHRNTSLPSLHDFLVSLIRKWQDFEIYIFSPVRRQHHSICRHTFHHAVSQAYFHIGFIISYQVVKYHWSEFRLCPSPFENS